MSTTAIKVAVSIPGDLYRAVERSRKKSGKSRSTIVQDALRRWLKEQKEAREAVIYLNGYSRLPESRREIKEAETMARDSWAEWKW